MKTLMEIVEEWEARTPRQRLPRAEALSGVRRWDMDFEYWLPERCCFVDGYWSPTRDLHADFCGWNVTRDCDFSTFSALLDRAGFFVEEVRGVAWCYGLVLSRLLLPEKAQARRPRRLIDGRLEEEWNV